MAKSKNPYIGRPPKYKSADEIQGLIDDYFTACKGRPLLDDDGKPRLDKWGHPIMLDAHPPTVTGLALALGFASRQGLLNYQGKKDFVDTITRAKTLVERYTEERLFDRDGTRGAIFSLQNNFAGWHGEKQQQKEDTPEERLSDALDAIVQAVKD